MPLVISQHLLNVFVQLANKRGIKKIRKVHENQVGLKSNVTHQLLVYADDVNLLGDNTDTIKKNKEILIHASKEVGIEINVNKTK
jgi:hypothetical protein